MISALQNHQTAIPWIITSGIRLRRKYLKTELKIPFESEEKMISKIKSVWKECASKLVEIRKSIKGFPDRLHTIKECNGSTIKMHFE